VALDDALAAWPSLPRPLLNRLVANLIEHLDGQDGDHDLEADGDEQDGTFAEDEPAAFAIVPHWAGAGCTLSDGDEDEGDAEPWGLAPVGGSGAP
jgi:hypothetical protein